MKRRPAWGGYLRLANRSRGRRRGVVIVAGNDLLVVFAVTRGTRYLSRVLLRPSVKESIDSAKGERQRGSYKWNNASNHKDSLPAEQEMRPAATKPPGNPDRETAEHRVRPNDISLAHITAAPIVFSVAP
jgi:hypothetical protein